MGERGEIILLQPIRIPKMKLFQIEEEAKKMEEVDRKPGDPDSIGPNWSDRKNLGRHRSCERQSESLLSQIRAAGMQSKAKIAQNQAETE